MVRVCIWCREEFGSKEPLEDKSRTHGICDSCFTLAIEKHRQQMLLSNADRPQSNKAG